MRASRMPGERWWPVLGISLLAVLPCFWQPRLQAADLASHTYGVWLAQLIEQGKAPGLTLVSQTSNILFDLLLDGSVAGFGFGLGPRVAVAACVLVLFWGSFRLAGQFMGDRPWFLVSSLLILSYGWTLHYGLMNFYLGLGLAIWGMALCWERPRWKVAAGAGLILLSLAAHPLPAAWATGLLAYSWVASRLQGNHGLWLLAAGILAIAGIRFYFTTNFQTLSAPPVVPVLPADQGWVFGIKYAAIALLLEVFWVFLLMRLVHLRGFGELIRGVPFQLFALTMGFVLIMPTWIKISDSAAPLSYITDRMTLPAGILLCCVLAPAKPLPWQKIGLHVLAGVFFVSLFIDARALNRMERRMEELMSTLPPAQRVVCSLDDPGIRIGLLKSICDRACIGRCFSYSFYEPSTLRFRIRPTGPSPVVETDHDRMTKLEDGGYVVRPEDLPMYQMAFRGGDLWLKPLKAGDVTSKILILASTPLLWGRAKPHTEH